jgi:hypothetical protein
LWLDMLQLLADSSPAQVERIVGSLGNELPTINPPQSRWPIPISFVQAMRAVNQRDDEVLAALKLPTYSQRIAALMVGSTDWGASALLTPMAQVEKYSDLVRMQNRLTQIALSLAAYKADHGGYPASLDVLAPNYLAAVPNDVFSEKPVIYAPTQQGYTLYSVGPNMADDGGKSQRPCDDIVASIP